MNSPCSKHTTDFDLTLSGARSCLTQDTLSPRSPFGPKSRACLVKPKTFERTLIEMDELENYFIWSDIGKGTFAVVKFATKKDSGQKVAIKVYEKQKLLDPIRKRSVESEIKILKRLQHPNLIKLHEYLQEKMNVYLVMDYVAGTSLLTFISRPSWSTMDEPACARIFLQLMQAIEYCHRHNVSHRDIKLENVIIDSYGKVTLIDFGFATVSSVRNKKSFVYCGTPNYMAPEIVKREMFAGEPTDIWAAGVLLFMMLVGKFPFASPKESGVFTRILKNDVVFPDFLSFKCQMLLKAMLEPCPNKRITAKLVLKHPWVMQKGKSIVKNTPLLGDDGDVECC